MATLCSAGGGLSRNIMPNDELDGIQQPSVEEEQTPTADDVIVPETEQEKAVDVSELKTRNEKLYARAKKAEEARKVLEAQLAKFKPKAAPDTASEIEEKVELRLSGLSLEQIKLAQKLRDPGQSLSDAAKVHKALLDALAMTTQAEQDTESKTPVPTTRSQTTSKTETYFGEIKDEKERRAAFEKQGAEILKRVNQTPFR